jgi:perosamine synthetase
MKNGEQVAAFERAFGQYVGARYAIGLCNGTATLHTALVALGVKPGDRVAVPPLTMSATTIAVLHAGAVPVFVDVDPQTWLMGEPNPPTDWQLPVSLYGLHHPGYPFIGWVDDAAQTLRPHDPRAFFTSYSFQASKVLSLGEGGMLVTNRMESAERAREFSSLGYRMRADQPRIDPATLKSPTFARHHHSLGYNYRMNDLTAARGLKLLECADHLLAKRREAATMYREAIKGCTWLTPQHVPEGWMHDSWAFAVATDTPARALELLDAVERHGGERPYAAWCLTYHEPAFRHLAPDGTCPVAESLQPRLVQFQTNSLEAADRNATALRAAIRELGG